MKDELQATPCPQQAYGTLPSQLAHVCTWRHDRWSKRRIVADKFRDRRSALMDWLERRGVPMPRIRDRFSGGTRWPKNEPKPRTCSYCGGVHPDDAIELIKRGWEVEGTDKNYKKYLHPPGHREALRNVYDSHYTQWIGPRSPVPPVKVYTYHFDQRQIAAFNYALDEEKK